MINSFYYFFSATPQVLAAILALFGVFVIFKIQNLKSQMIAIGSSILDQKISITKSDDLKLTIKVANILILDRIEKAIQRNDIEGLKSTIDLIEDKDFMIYRKTFNNLHLFLKVLIHNTIASSIFTSITIIICLTLIPFGDLIIVNIYVLYSLFFLVIISIIICFYLLISIITKSL